MTAGMASLAACSTGSAGVASSTGGGHAGPPLQWQAWRLAPQEMPAADKNVCPTSADGRPGGLPGENSLLHSAAGPQPNRRDGGGLTDNSLPLRHESLRARRRLQGFVVQRRRARKRQTTENTEDTEKTNHSAAGPQPNRRDGRGLTDNSLPLRHESLRARRRFQGFIVQSPIRERRWDHR